MKILVGIVLASVLALGPTAWTLDTAHSSLTFVVMKGDTEVHGKFTEMQASIVLDEQNATQSRLSATVRTASIDTYIAMRDGHLRKAQYFDAERFPEAAFVSDSVYATRGGYAAVGRFTLKGVTNVVTIPFTFRPDETGAWFEGEFDINRKDYGIGGQGDGIGNEVKIKLRVRGKPA